MHEDRDVLLWMKQQIVKDLSNIAHKGSNLLQTSKQMLHAEIIKRHRENLSAR